MEGSRPKALSLKQAYPSTFGPKLKRVKRNDGIEVSGTNKPPDERDEIPEKLIRPCTRSQTKENEKKTSQGQHEEFKTDEKNDSAQTVRILKQILNTKENHDVSKKNKPKKFFKTESSHQDKDSSYHSFELEKLKIDDDNMFEENSKSDDYTIPNQKKSWDILSWLNNKNQPLRPKDFEKWTLKIKKEGIQSYFCICKMEGHYTSATVKDFYHILFTGIVYSFHDIFPNIYSKALLIEHAIDSDFRELLEDNESDKHLKHTIFLKIQNNPIFLLKIAITKSVDKELKVLKHYFETLVKNNNYKKFSGLLIYDDKVMLVRYDGTSDDVRFCQSKLFNVNLDDFRGEGQPSAEFNEVFQLIICVLAQSIEDYNE